MSVSLPGKWLVIGSGSMVGSRFLELVDGNLQTVDSGEVDITKKEQVSNAVENFQGDYVINFAGATLVDEIEKTRPKNPNNWDALNQNMAYQVNVIGTKNIIAACKENGKFPIFISTGFVFDGQNGPYREDDPVAASPDKVCWYGWTKVLAEKEILSSGVDFLNIRISYPYRSEFEGKSDFARNFLNLYDSVQKQEKTWYPIFSDQTLTPTFIDDVSVGVSVLMEKKATGTYHIASPIVTTPYEFCCELLKVARGVQNPESIVPKGSLIEFQKTHPELAKRPFRGGEKVDKIMALGFTPTDWQSGIKKTFEGLHLPSA